MLTVSGNAVTDSVRPSLHRVAQPELQSCAERAFDQTIGYIGSLIEHICPSRTFSLCDRRIESSSAVSLFKNILSGPIADKCYSLKELETDIREEMPALRERLTRRWELEAAEFGRKHAGIIQLQQLFAELGEDSVVVPPPRGISTRSVTKLLQKLAPDLFVRRQKLADLYATYRGEISFFEREEVKQHLKVIDQQLVEAFRVISETPSLFRDLGVPESWLRRSAENGDVLMVRSSGPEDGKKVTNAGAHETVVGVEPTGPAVSSAVGDVVRSYFDPLSLANRMNGGLNPFEGELALSVTIQALIGEPIGGSNDPREIPRSVVIFTRDDHTQISAVAGHGEGVVNGARGISFDTFHVAHRPSQPDQLAVTQTLQRTPERLVPVRSSETGCVELQKELNPPSLCDGALLSEQQVREAYRVSKLIKEATGNGDVEGLFLGDRFYVVQARPEVSPTLLVPSYLDWSAVQRSAAMRARPSLDVEPVVSGRSSAFTVACAREILLANTLDEAERVYRPEEHRAVVISEREPPNSHPTINFRGQGVPCFHTENQEAVRAFLSRVDKRQPLVVCSQTGKFLLWHERLGEVEELLKDGHAYYPYRIGTSLPPFVTLPSKVGVSSPPPLQLKEWTRELIFNEDPQKSRDILELIRSHRWVKAFEERRGRLAEIQHNDRQLSLITQAADSLSKELHQTLEDLAALSETGKSKRMAYLRLVRKLDELLFSEEEQGLGRYSIASLRGPFAASSELLAYLKNAGEGQAVLSGLLLDGSMSPYEPHFDSWKEFLLGLEPIAQTGALQEEVGRLKELCFLMRRSGALPMFMTIFFPSIWEKRKDPVHALQKLNALLPQEQANQLLEWKDTCDRVDALSQGLQRFADPQRISAAIEDLEAEIERWMPTQQPLFQRENWVPASPIVKVIVLGQMEKLVGLYDSAIKTMLGSLAIPRNEEKVAILKHMVTGYLDLLEAWARSITTLPQLFHVPKRRQARMSYLKGGVLFDRYFRAVRTRFDGTKRDVEELSPSKKFSVSAGLFGKSLNPSMPKTVADVFTLAHQMLMLVLSDLNQELLATKSGGFILPEPLAKALADSDVIQFAGFPDLRCTSLEVTEKAVGVRCNLPLRTHAAELVLWHRRGEPGLTMECSTYGVGGHATWIYPQQLLDLLDFVGRMKQVAKPKMTTRSASFSIGIENRNDLLKAYEFFAQAARGTLELWEFFAYTNATLDSFSKEENELLSRNLDKYPYFLLRVANWFGRR